MSEDVTGFPEKCVSLLLNAICSGRSVSFSANANTAEKYTELVGGQFKVGVEGVAASGFKDAGASANLTISLTFTAFQE